MPKIVDHQARRAEITAVAVDLISSGGIEAATIREIANHSGYSKGVVEHYFENKEELIAAALEWVNTSYSRRAEVASAGLRGLGAVKACLEAALPMSAELSREWKVRLVFWAMAATDSNLAKQQGLRFERAAEHFSGHLQEAKEAGEITADALTDVWGRRLVNTVSGLAVAALHNPRFATRHFLQQEVDQIIAAMAGGSWPAA